MNKRTEWWTLFLVDVLLCTRAIAAGDTHSQGTLLAGTGLDWQRSGTLLQPAQEHPAVAPPAVAPQPPIPFTSPTGSFIINEAEIQFSGGCTAVGDLAVRCRVGAKQVSPAGVTRSDTQLCGHWLNEEKLHLWVYLINGQPDPTGHFLFGSGESKRAFVACSVADERNPDEWEWRSLGAVGKCLLWPRSGNRMGFLPKSADKGVEFNTCLRAVRADYCGNGVTHTVDGTHIDLYRTDEPHTSTPPNVLEATWNERGAICLIHARWLSLSPVCRRTVFTTVLGAPRGEAPPQYTGTEYHCDPAKLQEPQACTGDCRRDRAMMIKALQSGILSDDSLLP